LPRKLPYSGTSNVIVGNGTQLSILHVGQVSFPPFTKPLQLRNVLHVPNLKYTFLSVQKLYLDNNCEVGFDLSSIYIKDKQTGTTLLWGSSVVAFIP